MINDQLQLVFLLKNQVVSQSIWQLLNQEYACLLPEPQQEVAACASKKK